MGFGEIDLNDAFVSPFFVLASGVQTELFSLVLFGLDFGEVLVTLGSGVGAIEITAAQPTDYSPVSSIRASEASAVHRN